MTDNIKTHASSILELRRNANMLNLCSEYSQKWDNATDFKKMMDMALDAKGIEFVAASTNTSWGITTEYLVSNFSDYINGKYVSKQQGYTSECYAGYDKDITVRTTLLLVIDFCGKIVVPVYSMCNIYLDSNCTDIEIELGENSSAQVFVFGNRTKPKFTGDAARSRIYGMDKKKERLAWTKRRR